MTIGPEIAPFPSAEFAPFFLGVDENGLGPRLGPLVVTGVLGKFRDEKSSRWLRTRSRWPAALDDSKALVDFHDSSLGEAWARALLARNGVHARTPEEIVHAISIDAAGELTSPCPSHVKSQCWSAHGEEFLCTDAQVAKVSRTIDALSARGIELGMPRSVVTCTRRLNDAATRGRSRFDVDLHAMERLVLHAREVAGESIDAVCGKVGGFDFYDDAFDALAGHLRMELVAGRAKSVYRFHAVGTVAFERDADARHALVALASLVGKWLRDLLMRRVARFYTAEDAALPSPSGYHDPVTTRFITLTKPTRKRLDVMDDCFERKRVVRPS